MTILVARAFLIPSAADRELALELGVDASPGLNIRRRGARRGGAPSAGGGENADNAVESWMVLVFVMGAHRTSAEPGARLPS